MGYYRIYKNFFSSRFSLNILNKSENENIPTYLAANQLAEERIEKVGNVKLSHK